MNLHLQTTGPADHRRVLALALAALFATLATALAAPAPHVQGRSSGAWSTISDSDLNPDQAVTDFGNVSVGSSNDRRYRIRNAGDGVLQWQGASSSNPQFEILNTSGGPQGFPIPITGGDSREFLIRFTPDTTGRTAPTISLDTNATGLGAVYTFAVEGVGQAPDARISGRPSTNASFDNILDGETTPRLSEGTDFNFIPVGASVVRYFKLTNDGNQTLDPGSAFFSGGAASQFQISGLSLSNLSAGNSREFTITFTPTSAGTKTTTFNLLSDDPDENPYTFVVTGEGQTFPNIRVRGRAAGGATYPDIADNDLVPDQDVTDYGTVLVGQTGTRTYRIQNTGNATLTISSITTNRSTFTIPGPPASVAAGSAKDFVINFDPSTPGTVTATVTIRSNTPGDEDPYTFAITGTAIVPDARIAGRQGSSGSYTNIADGDTTPALADGTDFNFIPVGSSVTRQFRITNDGNAPLDINSTAFTGSHAAQFSVSGLALGNLNPGKTDDFTITFTPTSTGVKTTTFQLVSDDPDENPYDFALRGEGQAFPNIRVRGEAAGGATYPDIADNDLVPDQDVTDYGDVLVGQTGTRTYRIQNTGNATLTISSITTNRSTFTIPGPPASVPAGDSKDFVINFDPTTPGTVAATVTIRSNTPGSEDPYTFAITGTAVVPDARIAGRQGSSGSYTNIADGGTKPTLTDGTDFSFIPINSTVTRQFRLTNDGNAPLDINSTAFTGVHARDFSVSGLALGNLAPGSSDDFTITFAPTRTGVKTTTFQLVSDDPDENPYDFALRGEGQAFPNIRVRGEAAGGITHPDIDDADLVPDQDVTDFGDVDPGTTGTRVFRIENEGNATLTIDSIISNNPLFTIPGPPTSIPADEFRDFVIDFTPAVLGTQFATITINNNTPGDEAPYTFAIKGTGSGPEIAVDFYNSESEWVPIESGNAVFEFLPVNVSNGATLQLFRVTNLGDKNLNITGTDFGGSASDEFSVIRLFFISPILSLSPGESENFYIRFNPESGGFRNANFALNSNDGDEDPFRFDLRGVGLLAPTAKMEGRSGGTFTPWKNIASGTTIPRGDHGTQFAATAIAGGSVTRNFRLTNDGSSDLEISSIISNFSAFQISGAPATLSPGESETFDIIFDPSTEGQVNATIFIESNDAETPYTFAVTGYGWDNVAPRIEVDGSSIRATPIWHSVSHDDPDTRTANGTRFGSTTIDGNPLLEEISDFGNRRESVFRITNIGATPMVIDSVTSDSQDFSPYALVTTFDPGVFLIYPPTFDSDTYVIEEPIVLGPNESLKLVVNFNPIAYGNRTGRLIIQSDAIDESPFIIQLSGFADVRNNGPDIAFFPVLSNGQLDLRRNVRIGFRAEAGQSHSKEFALVNVGNEILTISDVSTGDPARFAASGAPSILSPGQQRNFQITYHCPAGGGNSSSTLTVLSNDPDDDDGNYQRTIGGVQGQPTLTVRSTTGQYISPTNLDPTPETDFGTATPGEPGVSKIYTMHNSSPWTLHIDAIEIDSTSFRIDAAPTEIAPESEATLILTYLPAGEGVESATLQIFSDAPYNNPYSFNLWGVSTGTSAPPEIIYLGTWGDAITLAFTNSPTETYSIQTSPDLLNWTTLPGKSGIPGTGSPFGQVLYGAATADTIFVRIMQE